MVMLAGPVAAQQAPGPAAEPALAPAAGAIIAPPSVTTPAPRGWTAQQVAEGFMRADTNRDGALTRAEAASLGIRQRFEEMDAWLMVRRQPGLFCAGVAGQRGGGADARERFQEGGEGEVGGPQRVKKGDERRRYWGADDVKETGALPPTQAGAPGADRQQKQLIRRQQ